jgi:acetoin utilization deacetylase AcuC-like enzyme
VAVLYSTHPEFLLHDAGSGHPERPARLEAVRAGVLASGVADEIVSVEPVSAPAEAVARVHPGAYVARLEDLDRHGGGQIDPDTAMSEHSLEAARLAAGAGLEAVRRLDAGEGTTALLAVRPPGHHATVARPMGFCLLNNVAVTAAALADRGERVLIVDYDAHHGNGTQDIFYDDPRVLFVSIHEYPQYPGTGSLHETGGPNALGMTINVPVPSGATGDVYRRALDELVAPAVEAWQPTWLLVSAGYDGHRRDPITDLGLASGDYADLASAVLRFVPPGRSIFFLEGGYDLDALAASVGATIASMAGERHRPEAATAGGPGASVVEAVRRLRDENGWD